jgi:hypothetical protein
VKIGSRSYCPLVTKVADRLPISGDWRMVAKCAPVRKTHARSQIYATGHASSARWRRVTIGVWARTYLRYSNGCPLFLPAASFSLVLRLSPPLWPSVPFEHKLTLAL